MNSVMGWLWELLFGCRHKHVSWPITVHSRTYRVCCDCGKEFRYSWDTLTYEDPAASRPLTRVLAKLYADCSYVLMGLAAAMNAASHTNLVLRPVAQEHIPLATRSGDKYRTTFRSER